MNVYPSGAKTTSQPLLTIQTPPKSTLSVNLADPKIATLTYVVGNPVGLVNGSYQVTITAENFSSETNSPPSQLSPKVDISQPPNLTLAQPEDVVIKGSTVSFKPVSGAQGYLIQIMNLALHNDINQNRMQSISEFDIRASKISQFEKRGRISINVGPESPALTNDWKAPLNGPSNFDAIVAQITAYASKTVSVPVIVPMKLPLFLAPRIQSVSGTTVRWQPVRGAKSYFVSFVQDNAGFDGREVDVMTSKNVMNLSQLQKSNHTRLGRGTYTMFISACNGYLMSQGATIGTVIVQ